MSKRILIAEDDQMSREILSSLAAAKGYDVVTVSDGIDLLTYSIDQPFDLIITDIMMGNLNGVSANEILKMQGNTVPVIAITAMTPDELLDFKDKFTMIYHKPCDYKELFKYIESQIG